MTERNQVARAIGTATDLLGGIDVCVDIIGGATWNAVGDVTPDEWHWAIENNLTQVFTLFQAVGRQMVHQGTGGSMVALASVDGTVAAAYHAPYGAAKAGVISLAKSFAYELGRHGIRVNAVAPGNVGSGNDDQPEGIWAVDDTNPLIAPGPRTSPMPCSSCHRTLPPASPVRPSWWTVVPPSGRLGRSVRRISTGFGVRRDRRATPAPAAPWGTHLDKPWSAVATRGFREVTMLSMPLSSGARRRRALSALESHAMDRSRCRRRSACAVSAPSGRRTWSPRSSGGPAADRPVRPPMGHDSRLPVGEYVLHPIGTVAIGQGDQKTVVLPDRDDRGFVGPTRTASDVTDDGGAGLLRPGRSHGEWPRRLRQSAQGCLDGSLHSSRVPRVGPRRRAG